MLPTVLRGCAAQQQSEGTAAADLSWLTERDLDADIKQTSASTCARRNSAKHAQLTCNHVISTVDFGLVHVRSSLDAEKMQL